VAKRKTEIQLTKEDIADLIRTKHRLLGRRRDRRAIDEELARELTKFDIGTLKGELAEAPDVNKKTLSA
jgi:U3 small nucleolar RNA-associated protein 14